MLGIFRGAAFSLVRRGGSVVAISLAATVQHKALAMPKRNQPFPFDFGNIGDTPGDDDLVDQTLNELLGELTDSGEEDADEEDADDTTDVPLLSLEIEMDAFAKLMFLQFHPSSLQPSSSSSFNTAKSSQSLFILCLYFFALDAFSRFRNFGFVSTIYIIYMRVCYVKLKIYVKVALLAL